jgi:ribose transport system ATP-binding protein
MAEVEAFLKQHGIPLDPRIPVSRLPFAYRQMTEICKALMGDVRLLILDEPTSALTGDEEQILFDAIRTVTSRGVGVIYVTHRLNEVFRVSQRVTVFRDGGNVGTFATAETDMKQLVAAIIGPNHAAAQARRLEEETVAATPQASPGAGAPVLSLTQVSNDRLRQVDLEVRAGEIHGLAGLIGSGRTEILETIFGLRPARSGTIAVGGQIVELRNPTAAIDQAIALVPEDRHVQGLVLEHSIERNLTLPRLRHFSRWGWMQQGDSTEQAAAAIRRLSVKAPGPSTPVKNLSGGNQQKVVFAKWNNPRPRILLLDEPTVGVDVGAREEIYGLVRDAAREGTGVLVVSSDLPELLMLCTRISIVVDGRVLRTFDRDALGDAEQLHHFLQTEQTLSEQTA